MLSKRVWMVFAAGVMASACLTLGGSFTALAQSCGYFDPISGDYVACASENDTSDGPRRGNGQSNDECFAVVVGQPKYDDPIWRQYIPAGADPADYVLMQSGCGSTDWQAPDIFALLVNREPAPDPYALAREAIARLPIPTPAIEFGPDASKIAVNVPVWLWISNSDSVSASATDRTVTVTATASLVQVTWLMGEPAARRVVCVGAGQAPTAGADLWDPPCGYTYQRRSLPERTSGAGSWLVSAEVTWHITWSANTGESGTDQVTVSSAARAAVGEYRTVIVAGT